MPAGDLITGPWQLELRGVLTGAGTEFGFGPAGISGLGVPRAKVNDTPRAHAHGSYRGRDFTEDRDLYVDYYISVGTGTDEEKADQAGGLWFFLCDVWETSETDLELHLRLPGLGHVSYLGRPRGLVDDLTLLRVGVCRGLATFECDPTMTVESGS